MVEESHIRRAVVCDQTSVGGIIIADWVSIVREYGMSGFSAIKNPGHCLGFSIRYRYTKTLTAASPILQFTQGGQLGRRLSQLR